MKLIVSYNRTLLPVILLFTIGLDIANFFLIRGVLRYEVDQQLRRTRLRLISYIAVHRQLPDVRTFDDLKIDYKRAAKAIEKPLLSYDRIYIPEKAENQIARKLVFTIWVKGELYDVSIRTALEGTGLMTRMILFIFTVTAIVAAVCLALVSRAVLKALWRPFYGSLEAIRSFNVYEGGSIRFPHTHVEEFAIMNENFRLVSENAAKEYRLLKEFTENASHEIQTPLAVIRSKLDLLVQHESLSEAQSEMFREAYDALAKLSRLNQSLLLLAKIDNGQFFGREKIDLGAKVESKISQLQELWQCHRYRLRMSIVPSEIEADPELIEILLNNVMGNATWHNIAQGEISIVCRPQLLKVTNSGEHKVLDREKLFTRFYKASVNSSQNGLGLSIIKSVCDASGISVEYSYQNGYHTFAFSW